MKSYAYKARYLYKVDALNGKKNQKKIFDPNNNTLLFL